jgi:hypothetical protein
MTYFRDHIKFSDDPDNTQMPKERCRLLCPHFSLYKNCLNAFATVFPDTINALFLNCSGIGLLLSADQNKIVKLCALNG